MTEHQIGLSFARHTAKKSKLNAMNTNNFTIKVQEVLEKAFNIAQAEGNQAVEAGHLLKGLLTEEQNISKTDSLLHMVMDVLHM